MKTYSVTVSHEPRDHQGVFPWIVGDDRMKVFELIHELRALQSRALNILGEMAELNIYESKDGRFYPINGHDEFKETK